MAVILTIGIVTYIMIGAIRVVSDHRQPITNRPDYVRNPKLWQTLIIVIIWPLLFFQDTMFFYRYYKANSMTKGFRRIGEFFDVVVLHHRRYRSR